MRYDTCVRRGMVRDALTDFQQGGAKWYVRGNIAADSGSKRVYVHAANFTSEPQARPDDHFPGGPGKREVVRGGVLRFRCEVRDAPFMGLPFIFQDMGGGGRSGILFPRFGLKNERQPHD